MGISRVCEHILAHGVHVGHFDGGPIQKDGAAYCLERITAGTCPSLFCIVEIIEDGIRFYDVL